MTEETTPIRLTQFSHGAGCGCKISPKVLDIILKNNEAFPDFPNLLVGNSSRDDAAVYDLGNGQALISTTDFFMPIVDDPFDFGRIASANAISDVYAMGGRPLLAIAVLGWPIEKIAAEVAAKVIAGSRAVCAEAGIPLAGGHSIDSPEPIFGLAVNGMVQTEHLKKNNTAHAGDILFLTKKIGVGILSTASKKGCITKEDRDAAVQSMTRLNKIGSGLGSLQGVHALTDVTGFGLFGHLAEMAEGSGLSAEVHFKNIPFFDHLATYLEQGCIPGGSLRNWSSYGHKVAPVSDTVRTLLCDPQTSGGLLVAVDPSCVQAYHALVRKYAGEDFCLHPIGIMTAKKEKVIYVNEV